MREVSFFNTEDTENTEEGKERVLGILDPDAFFFLPLCSLYSLC